MKTFGWLAVVAFLVWLALAQHGMVRYPWKIFYDAMHRAASWGESEPPAPDVAPVDEETETLPPATDCPDGADCVHGGKHWQGESFTTCLHPGGHKDMKDPSDITGHSCEGITFVDLRGNEKYETRAWKARVQAERSAREADGIDLSFLKGAPPAERREWVESWRRTHPDMPRSEIVHLLCKYSEITDRQARRDVSAALPIDPV